MVKLKLIDRPKTSPPDKMPSLRYPRLANVTIHRSGAETTVDIYHWVSRHQHGTLLHTHITPGDGSWIRHGGTQRYELEPMPTFASWLFQYLWENPWSKPPRPYTDIVVGTFSLTADDARIFQTLRDELSRMVRPVLAEIQAEREAVQAFSPPVDPVPFRLTVIRSSESEAQS